MRFDVLYHLMLCTHVNCESPVGPKMSKTPDLDIRERDFHIHTWWLLSGRGQPAFKGECPPSPLPTTIPTLTPTISNDYT